MAKAARRWGSIVGLTALIVVIGAVAIFIDALIVMPTPPAWLFSWAQLIAVGWALSFGPRILRQIVAMLDGENVGAPRKVPGTNA